MVKLNTFNTSPHRVSSKNSSFCYCWKSWHLLSSPIICPAPPSSTSSLLITHFTFHHVLHSSIYTIIHFISLKTLWQCGPIYLHAFEDCNKRSFAKYKEKQIMIIGDFPGGAVIENLPANAGDTGSSPGLGRSHMPQGN